MGFVVEGIGEPLLKLLMSLLFPRGVASQLSYDVLGAVRYPYLELWVIPEPLMNISG